MKHYEETVESEEAHAQALARTLVEEAWNLGAGPMLLKVEYEGALWEVSVRVAESEG